ncbi:hypothetical protein J6590_078551 [Homalodisca vitripennis]|nr:hypothetical protein J6590_078551 [Homalodisca vitripennis]
MNAYKDLATWSNPVSQLARVCGNCYPRDGMIDVLVTSRSQPGHRLSPPTYYAILLSLHTSVTGTANTFPSREDLATWSNPVSQFARVCGNCYPRDGMIDVLVTARSQVITPNLLRYTT